MYAGGVSGALALGAGSGVSLVTFRNVRVFYPLNFTPTLVGAVGQSLGVYISPERSFRFSLAAPSFTLAFFRGMCGLWGATPLKSQWAASCWASVRGGVGGGGCSFSTGWREARRSCWRLG
jgi:hypothetical protein